MSEKKRIVKSSSVSMIGNETAGWEANQPNYPQDSFVADDKNNPIVKWFEGITRSMMVEMDVGDEVGWKESVIRREDGWNRYVSIDERALTTWWWWWEIDRIQRKSSSQAPTNHCKKQRISIELESSGLIWNNCWKIRCFSLYSRSFCVGSKSFFLQIFFNHSLMWSWRKLWKNLFSSLGY